MPEIDISTAGSLLLAAILVSAAYTFALSLMAASGRKHLLKSVRLSSLATVALVCAAVFVLAYAFQSHDFRIRYVSRYSDRSMSGGYLWTALWGGQDGSLLWWSFLLSLYTAGFTVWVKDRYRELQPYIFATLMTVLGFFIVIQLFAANPFAPNYGQAPLDGEGLNPLLQNYWMAIHPPALYMGLTGWAVPFGFVVAALFTGRLNQEWIHGVRRWVLLAYAFLTLGNLLGMFWSYEELGWGGYWAWDPVENASFLPWLTATAYIHSVMIQERRGIMRVWNVFLLSLTFILTIFGTFLTRSGLIASVHSFARSDIGTYFAYFLVALILFTMVLIGWRLIDLKYGKKVGIVEFAIGTLVGILVAIFLASSDVVASTTARLGAASIGALVVVFFWVIQEIRLKVFKVPPLETQKPRDIESMLSREFAFLLNNWILLAMAVFVLVATTFPLLSEWLRDETVTVGPGYYNKWMVPLGLLLIFLTAVGPLIAWRRASGRGLLKAFRAPLAFAGSVGLLHYFAGEAAGYPPFAAWDDIYDASEVVVQGFTLQPGVILAAIFSVAPLATTTLVAFAFGTVIQEFWRGTETRVRLKKESVFTALLQLTWRARRRYGGYVVHTGVLCMYLGFAGSAYDVEQEASILPGETLSVGGFDFRYEDAQMSEDANKRALYTTLTVLRNGEAISTVTPAKFIYRSHPEMPTTEVDIETTLTHDLYVIMSTVDPQTLRGTFRVIKRPLVFWIWFGGFLMLFGITIAGAPSIREILGEPSTSRGYANAAATALLILGAAFVPVVGISTAHAQTSSLHAGHVTIEDPDEQRLFSRLLCECGDCERLPLDTCGCSWAESMRGEIRAKRARGDSMQKVIDDYRERFGAQAIAIPPDDGLGRMLWAVPMLAIGLAIVALVARARKWGKSEGVADEEIPGDEELDDYDKALDEELRALEGD